METYGTYSKDIGWLEARHTMPPPYAATEAHDFINSSVGGGAVALGGPSRDIRGARSCSHANMATSLVESEGLEEDPPRNGERCDGRSQRFEELKPKEASCWRSIQKHGKVTARKKQGGIPAPPNCTM